MTLTLTPDLQKLIDERVRTGKYESAEDVVAAAIANLEQQDRLTELSAGELDRLYPDIRVKLAEGIAAAAAGKLVDGEEFFDQFAAEEDQFRKST
jgi:antitoxin ParD1/3/4